MVESQLEELSQSIHTLKLTPGVAKVEEGKLVVLTEVDPLEEYKRKVEKFYKYEHEDTLSRIGEALEEIPQKWFRGAMSKSDPFGLKSTYYWLAGNKKKAIETEAMAWRETDKAFDKVDSAVLEVLTSPLATLVYSAGIGYVAGAGLGVVASKAPTAARFINLGASSAIIGAAEYEAYTLLEKKKYADLFAMTGMAALTVGPFVSGMKSGYHRFIPKVEMPTKIKTPEGTKYLVSEPQVKVSKSTRGFVESTGLLKREPVRASVVKYTETPGKAPLYVKSKIKGWLGKSKSPEFYIRSPTAKIEGVVYQSSEYSGAVTEAMTFGSTRTKLVGSRLGMKYKSFDGIVKSWDKQINLSVNAVMSKDPLGSQRIMTIQYSGKYPKISKMRLKIAKKHPLLAKIFGPKEFEVVSGKFVSYEGDIISSSAFTEFPSSGEGVKIGGRVASNISAISGKETQLSKVGQVFDVVTKNTGMRTISVLNKPLLFVEQQFPQLTTLGFSPVIDFVKSETKEKKSEILQSEILSVETIKPSISLDISSKGTLLEEKNQKKVKSSAIVEKVENISGISIEKPEIISKGFDQVSILEPEIISKGFDQVSILEPEIMVEKQSPKTAIMENIENTSKILEEFDKSAKIDDQVSILEPEIMVEKQSPKTAIMENIENTSKILEEFDKSAKIDEINVLISGSEISPVGGLIATGKVEFSRKENILEIPIESTTIAFDISPVQKVTKKITEKLEEKNLSEVPIPEFDWDVNILVGEAYGIKSRRRKYRKRGYVSLDYLKKIARKREFKIPDLSKVLSKVKI